MTDAGNTATKALMLVLDRNNEKGLTHWIDELDKRKVPALVLLDENLIEHHKTLIQTILSKGFEVGCVFNEKPFWGESYETQSGIMKRILSTWAAHFETPLRVFGSKYFAYNEDTLKIADDVGIQYLLARGTAGVRAVVYQPEEYGVRIVSVSNVPSRELGTGSLCDESLRCRSSSPRDLLDILYGIREDRIILVAQTHLSGVKLNWWNAYQEFFDADRVTWQNWDAFVGDPMVLPYAEIPVNTQTDYIMPNPSFPWTRSRIFRFSHTSNQLLT